MTKPRTKTREELTAEIEQAEKKSGSMRTRKKSLTANLPLKNARNETTAYASGAASWKALCRSLSP